MTSSGAHPGHPQGAVEPSLSLLRLAVGDEVLAVPIDAVREILEVGRLTALPRTPDFVRGVMNLRGAVVPVIDLSARLDRGPATLGRRSCIVVVEVHALAAGAVNDADAADEDSDGDTVLDDLMVVGLLVDAVFEVFDVEANEVEPVPSLGTRVRPEFLSGMTRARGQVIGVLATDRLLASADLTDAIAAWRPH